MFFAERGQGAYGPGGRLRVSGRNKLSEAVISTRFAYKSSDGFKTPASEIEKLLPQVAGLRNFGSAALDLAYVAAGRFDGYVEYGLEAWDYAAGIVLVREAGGLVSDETNGQKMLENGNMVAGNEDLHAALLKSL